MFSAFTKRVFAVAALVIGLSVPSFAEDTQETASLYSRLGGYDTIAAVVDSFFERFDADPSLAPFLGGISTDSGNRIRQMFVDFLCARTGGPCVYTGRDMRTSHGGLKITDAHWQATLGHLKAALDSAKVGTREKQEVLAFLETLKKDIVMKP